MRTPATVVLVLPVLLLTLATPAAAAPSKCSAAKMKAAGKKAASKAKCWSKAFAKGQPVDPGCLTKAETKFGAAFAKAELANDCYTTNDTAGVEAIGDSCVDDMVNGLGPTTTTTTTSTTTTTVANTCVDGMRDGNETDIDCGGGICPQCNPGQGCNVGSDCTSGVCSGAKCQAPSCADGVKNGAETDVDCGGGTCPTCSVGKGCQANSDCTSGNCMASMCVP